jgi:hypothetical protein
MARKNSRADLPTTIDGTTLLPVPTPPINLHDLEAVRREMARVYRDMRGKKIDTQDGTRLVYVLGQIAKVHEIAVLEKRLVDLEKLTHEPR